MSNPISPSDTPHSTAPQERQFFGQPWGLANLFGIELWERFSFYGMQSLLAFYLYYSVAEGGLGMDQAAALSIVGAYGGFVYMTSLIASFVADRMLGSERTLFYSAILVMIGHVALALLPGYAGLSVGLVAIAVGSGGVKTCAQVVLGRLYNKADPRRDAGFSIFYMAINIGGLLGPLVTGWLWGWQGFHWGFGAAAIGMAVGLAQYIAMRRTTIGAAGHDVPNPLPRSAYPKWMGGAVVLAIVVVALIATGVVKLAWLSTIVAVIALIAVVTLLWQMRTSPLTTEVEKSRILGYIPMLVVGVIFFAIFQSQFTVLAVYADQRADLNLFGWQMAPGQVTSFNPVFIILFSPVFAWLWTKLGSRQPSSPMKFGVASIIIGVSLFFFLPYVGGEANSTPIFVLIWILFLFTMGELMLSPVGNSLATKVAPEAFQSRMMAVWMLAVSMGTALSGTLGAMYDPTSAAAEYSFFITLAIAAIVVGLALIAVRAWVTRQFVDVK